MFTLHTVNPLKQINFHTSLPWIFANLCNVLLIFNLVFIIHYKYVIHTQTKIVFDVPCHAYKMHIAFTVYIRTCKITYGAFLLNNCILQVFIDK
jgi:hypothetical protein